MSLWEVDDERANLPVVLIALAANREELSNVDYLLFPTNLTEDCGTLKAKAGETPCLAANKWHWDLGDISVERLCEFGTRLFYNGEVGRMQSKEVKRLFLEMHSRGEIDASKLKPKIRAALD
jgi:hypothetical protein